MQKFEVLVQYCSAEEAEIVMNERLCPDEDYGFDYVIKEWKKTSEEKDQYRYQVEIEGCTREEAEKVMLERFFPEEEYGFDYVIAGWGVLE